ncbi:MAG: DNA internalization-related competence protein ComEC/Rec2 [Deltaproteobacteria bacterium]|nr:DNA internalization-related competence protein ComEC/Rec2 [Deltaproteobacteria bacterium]
MEREAVTRPDGGTQIAWVGPMLVAAACLFSLGLVLAPHLPSLRWPAGLALGLAVLLGYVGRRARARSWAAPLVVASFAAGLAAGPRAVERSLPRGTARLEGRVVSVRLDRDADVVVDRGRLLESGGGLPGGARVRVEGLGAAPGDRVRLLVSLGPMERFHNPTPHPDWEDGRNVDGLARLLAPPHVVDDATLGGALHDARQGLRRRLDATLPPRSAGIARALLLGDGAAVARQDRDAVQRAGLAHLLAVSGLHVALVVGAFFLGCRGWLRRRGRREPERLAALTAIPVAFGFALMAGGAPSAWRAAGMAAIGLLAIVMRRRPRGGAVAALTVIVYALVRPEDGARPGFLLSVLATAAIVAFPIPKEGLRAAAVVSARTTLATAPLVVWCFGSLPPLGVLANVVLVPVAVLLLVPLAFVHALLAGIGAGAVSAPLFTTACDGLLGAAALFGAGSDPIPPPSVAQGVLIALLCFGLLAARSWRGRVALVVAGLLGLAGAEWHLRAREQPTDRLRITMLDVGQGDGALVDLPNGELLLIDAGGGRPDPGARALVPLLHARRRHEVALAILTHPHPDHFGGLRAVHDAFPVRELWDSGQAEAETPHGPVARLLRSARRSSERVRLAASVCGRPRRFGDAELEVLWPCPGYDPGYDPNDNSIVVRLSYGERRFLFTGDVETLAERALVESGTDLRADWLKVPHHGSRTSSTDAFLDAVRPRLAAVSCGRLNRFGHPHPEVAARYDARGIPLYRTDTEGGLIFESDGRTIRALPTR